ncbi:hypothetical protein C4D60_Mb06t01380 [Musa balbisiana]|uniref:Uncharacterized protein n=1 Tax=Musa balbisiana TaxID=52838 RepID=A0A4S8IJV5_MUSBA|nr:hypothetical protein C4D60_Mb06t01380 [Musa balbisiana]
MAFSSSSTLPVPNYPATSLKTRPCGPRQGMSLLAPQGLPLAAPVLHSRPVRTPEAISGLASVWRKIHGADDWSGLVDPLSPLLREAIVRYGELVAACYKAFDVDPTSPRHLNCKYGKRRMLREVGLGSSGYEITKYLYATPGVEVPMQAEIQEK